MGSEISSVPSVRMDLSFSRMMRFAKKIWTRKIWETLRHSSQYSNLGDSQNYGEWLKKNGKTSVRAYGSLHILAGGLSYLSYAK